MRGCSEERRLKILVIEDETTNFVLLKGMLAETGEVTRAELFGEGVRLLATEEFDVVLTDMALPDCPFASFPVRFAEARRLRPAIPMIAITGSGDDAAGAEMLKYGAQDYLIKGEFGKRQLLRAIRYAFERKSLEDTLKQAKAWSDQVLDLVPSAVFTVDTKRMITGWNKQAELLTGYAADEIIGRDCMVFAIEPCAARCGVMCPDVPKPIKGKECLIRRKDGEVRHISKSADLLRNAAGTVVGAVESFEDITDRKRVEESREQIERIIRHDLKTPMIGVKGVAELLKDSPNLSAEQLTYVRMLDESGDLMLDMLDMSLILCKMERGVYSPHIETADLVAMVGKTLLDLRKIVSARKVTVRTTVEGKTPPEGKEFPASVDPFICRVMLSNLIANAVEASPSEGSVGVDLSRVTNGVRIVIRNSGAVPVEIRGRFFEKYATFGKKSGTGLGAYSARLTAKAHGGDITLAVSDADDTTAITVSLPHA